MVTSKTLRAIGAGLVLLVLLVAPPVLLITVIGNPWPAGGVALNAELSDGAIVGLLAVVVWVLWVQLLVCVIAETRAALAGRHSTVRVPATFGFQRDLARRLVTAVVVAAIASPVAGAVMSTASATTSSSTSTSSTSASATPAAGDGAGTTARGGPSAALAGTQDRHDVSTSTAASGSSDAAAPAAAKGQTVTVHRGDDLWSIAERHLGDGSRWKEIRDLNEGQTMNGGRVFKAAEQIQPGWDLQMPGDADLGDQTQQPAKGKAAGGVEHRTVHAGDTLSEIALEETGDAESYPQLAAASDIADPDHIEPGWTIAVPEDLEQSHEGDPTAPGARAPQEGGPRQQTSAGKKAEAPAEAKRAGHPDQAPTHETSRDGGVESGVVGSGAGCDAGEARDDVGSLRTADEGVGATAGPTDDSVLNAPWVLAGLTGAGALLAGGLWLALRSRRRAQFRARRPGRAIAAPPAELAPVERTIRAAGGPTALDVGHLDEVLLRLAASVAEEGAAMPPVAAAEISGEVITLHLSAAADLPSPWQGSPDRTHWTCERALPIEETGPPVDAVEPPYPLLVTIGADAAGATWLLNCEQAGTLSIAGDRDRGRDLARHLASQVCVNPWSEFVQLDCVGIGEELDALGHQVRYHSTDTEAVGEAVDDVRASAEAMAERAIRNDAEVYTGRTGQVTDDVWPARMLIVDTGAGVEVPPAVKSLQQAVSSQPERAATAILLAADETGSSAATLRVSRDGHLTVDPVGLELSAVGLTAEESRGCAALLVQSANDADIDMPVDDTATEGWESYADAAGSLRPEYTRPREDRHRHEEPMSTLLEDDDTAYVQAGAVVADDLEALAPAVPDEVRSEVEDADPELDADVADWFDENCRRPRLSLLGPISARTRGKALTERKPYFTELLTFLALNRRHGVTTDQVCDAFGIKPTKAHTYLNVVRDWLGENPSTGLRHLPDADKAPAAKTRGVNVYQVDQGLLVDADLLRRLHLRGKARGRAEGQQDLLTALRLVQGVPFDQARKDGLSWLAEGERHDHYIQYAITDVVCTVVAHALAEHDLDQARSAAELGVLAVSESEIANLCMVRVVEVGGDSEEATRLLRETVINRSDDGGAPTELSARTENVIDEHQWLAS